MTETIIDRTQAPVDFVNWVDSQGFKIVLTNDGTWITATLQGTRWISDGLHEFVAFGKTREQAIAALAQRCSGQQHNPQAKDRFLFVQCGPTLSFPSFA